MAATERKRMLIWGKTAPELSTKYFETVCTGAVLEDGSPIRIYPVPYRYMSTALQFKKYQWITATIMKSESDPRPETFRIDWDTIEPGEVIPTDKKEWLARSESMFKNGGWIFESIEHIEQAGKSLGVVTPKEIKKIELKKRPTEEQAEYEVKKNAIRQLLENDRQQLRMFEEDMPPGFKEIDFVDTRVAVTWISGSGKQHTSQILDWEVTEAVRKHGGDKALEIVKKNLNSETHAPRFYIGNFRLYPNRFSIVGLWYPQRMKPKGGTLFS